ANYRPRLRADLTWARLKSRRGTPYTMLADRPRLYLRLGPHDDFLASRMDGSRRVSDLVIDYFRQFGRFGFDRIATLVRDLRNASVAGLIALVLAFYTVIFIHESAHALTAKHFGRRVDEGGFMLYYFIPSFYVNVTDAWLIRWSRRVAIFWAGPYSGFVLAGLSSILVALLPGPSLLTTLLFKIP